jgi:hypothetical protein
MKDKSKMFCNKCGAANDDTSKWCTLCGHPLLEEISCVICGKPLKPDAKFCDGCGEKTDSPTSQIFRHAEAEEMYWKLNPANGGKSFWLFLSEYTWWWVPLSLVSFFLIGDGTNALIIFVAAVWLFYKYFAWKEWAVGPEKITLAPSQPLSMGRLLAAIFFSAIAAYIVASEPDHNSFFHDQPYEGALAYGYSPEEAEKMVPLINQVRPDFMPYSHSELFHTSTGWFWFVVMTSFFSWRLYKLITPKRSQKEKK